MVDPWFFPDAWRDGHVTALAAADEGVAIARVSTSHRLGRISLLDYHYTVATSEGVDRFTERHELALFTQADYEAALARGRPRRRRLRPHPGAGSRPVRGDPGLIAVSAAGR